MQITCTICDWPSPSVDRYPQRYGDAWIWIRKKLDISFWLSEYGVHPFKDEPICSVCLEEIRKHKKAVTAPVWHRTYMTRDEKRQVNTIRQQAKRGKINAATRDRKIRLIEKLSRLRFLDLHQGTYVGPENFKLDGGWLDFLNQHQFKTSGADPVKEIAEIANSETEEPVPLDDTFNNTDLSEWETDDSEQTYRGRKQEADYSYSHGFRAHDLHKPPRDMSYDVNHSKLTRESYRESALGQGYTTLGKRAKQAWTNDYPDFPGW